MNWRGRVGGWVLLACEVLAGPAVVAAIVLHYDAPLAHRLSGARIGPVTVAEAVSGIAVVSSAWSLVSGALGRVKKWVKPQPYASVGKETERRLTEAAADLADTLRDYADAEIDKRGLKDPEPLPVRWQRVAARADASGRFVRLGAEHVDAIDTIGGQLLASGRDRFVLVGEPGSGKSSITLFLQRDLIITGSDGGRVPLVLPLSSWDQENSTLEEWATAHLKERDPNLAAPLNEQTSKSVAQRLVHDRRIWLILDAMDERSEKRLSRVFASLNKLGRDYPMIVTCRSVDYVKATRGSSVLNKAVIFELLAPKTEVIEQYLVAAEERKLWDAVFAELREPKSPLAQALSTPLMVWLTRRIYEEKPHELADVLASGRFRNRTTLENHLLDRFIPTVYEAEAARFTRYFRFLAEHIKAREDSEYLVPSGKGRVPMADKGLDIAWWRLVQDRRARLADLLLLFIVGGLLPGTCVGLGWATSTWNWLPHPAPLLSGLALGLISTVGMAKGCMSNDPPPTGIRFARPSTVKAPIVVLGFALFVGAAASLAMSKNLSTTYFALIVAMPVALAYTFTNPYVDAERVSTPLRHYRADIYQSLLYTVAYGLGVGCLAALYRSWPISLSLGALAGIAGGFTYGAVYKIAYGQNMPSGMVAWVRFRIAHLRLAATGRLPWHYFAFLEQAHELGVLRQSGGNYQFSHGKLRDRLVLEPAEAGKELSE